MGNPQKCTHRVHYKSLTYISMLKLEVVLVSEPDLE